MMIEITNERSYSERVKELNLQERNR